MALDPMEQSFLNEIRDNPQEAAPRLIYADWLAEQDNDDQRLRGELMQAQRALAELPPDDPARLERAARERELLPKLTQMVRDRLRQMNVEARRVTFRDGLLHLELRPAVFEKHPELFTEFPLVSVRMNVQSSNEVHALAKAAHLARLTSLNLSGNQIGDAGAQALAASPQLARLTELDLGYSGIGDAGAQALAASPHLACVPELQLSYNDIGDAGAAALAASPHLARLTALHLEGNGIGAAGARALARSPYLQ